MPRVTFQTVDPVYTATKLSVIITVSYTYSTVAILSSSIMYTLGGNSTVSAGNERVAA